jgi:hypothetical protein
MTLRRRAVVHGFRGARNEAYSPAVAAVTPQSSTFEPAGLLGVLEWAQALGAEAG